MRWPRIIRWAIVGLAVLLVVPPAVVWAKQMTAAYWWTAEHGSSVAALQLYRAYQVRGEYAQSPNTISHPYDYPHIECDAYLPVSEGKMEILLQGGSSALRSQVGDWERVRILQERYTIPTTTALTACIEASVLAPICESAVREAFQSPGQVARYVAENIGMTAEEQGKVYCRAVKAVIAAEQSK